MLGTGQNLSEYGVGHIDFRALKKKFRISVDQKHDPVCLSPKKVIFVGFVVFLGKKSHGPVVSSTEKSRGPVLNLPDPAF